MKRGAVAILLTSTLLLLGACGSEESDEGVGATDNGEVIVNNGDLEGKPENTESEEEVVVPTREVHQDEVPKTGRDKIIQDSIQSEIPYGDRNDTDKKPDLSVEYEEVNGNKPEDVEFSIPYMLYFADEKGRAVGGEGVIKFGTISNEPEDEEGTEAELYELELLSNDLFNDERGLEERNKVQVTKQAYNLVTGFNKKVYEGIDPNEVDNEIFVRVQALYLGEGDTIPYGIHYEAQSLRGDIQINTIIHNVQKGYEVNHQNGEIREGGSGA